MISIFWRWIQSLQCYKGINYLNHHIILLIAITQKFSDDDYLAISWLILLSYVDGVDVWLGEHCDFFRGTFFKSLSLILPSENFTLSMIPVNPRYSNRGQMHPAAILLAERSGIFVFLVSIIPRFGQAPFHIWSVVQIRPRSQFGYPSPGRKAPSSLTMIGNPWVLETNLGQYLFLHIAIDTINCRESKVDSISNMFICAVSSCLCQRPHRKYLYK